MDRIRNISRKVKGIPTVDGAGVQLVRVLGRDDVSDIDPFLMMDAFDSANPADYIKGFPLHPHRGIETFTYLIEGEFDHRDTLGNSGRITSGQAHWMNSGRGILHEEMPVASPRLFGLQLWINLPKEHKMTAPTYHDILAQDMPSITEESGIIRVVAGSYGGCDGARGEFVQPTILDITLFPRGRFTLSVSGEDTLFAYVLHGSGAFGDCEKSIQERTAVIFGPGDILAAAAGEKGMRFMAFSGKPLGEPVAWAGPIVMNTQEELKEAFRELETGNFVKA